MMKSVLSWIALGLCSIAFYYIQQLIVILVLFIYGIIYSLSSTMFWIILILGGLGGLSIIMTAILMGAVLSVSLSQVIRKSKSGVRYIVISSLYILTFILLAVILYVGILSASNMFVFISSIIIMILFEIVCIIMGIQKTAEDGPPPTKKERLETKLDKIISKESLKNTSSAIQAAAKKKGITVEEFLESMDNIAGNN